MITALYQTFKIIKRRGALQLATLVFVNAYIPLLAMLPLMILLPLIRVVMNPGKGLGSRAEILPDFLENYLNDILQNTPPQDLLIVLIIAAAVAQIVQGLISTLVGNITSIFLTKKELKLSNELFRNYLTYDYGRLNLTSDPLTKIKAGCSALSSMVGSSMALGQGLIMVSISGATLLYLFPIPGLYGIGSLIFFMILLQRAVAPYIKSLGKEQELERLEDERALIDQFSALKELKILGREMGLSKKFTETTEKNARKGRALAIVSNAVGTILSSLHYISLLIGFFAAVRHGYPPESLGTFLIAYTLLIMKFTGGISQISGTLTGVAATKVTLDMSYKLLITLSELSQDKQTKFKTIPFEKSVELKNVNFSYPGTDVTVLHDINITIKKGDFVALVGKNGSGKTTLIDLIAAYHKPDEGELLIDGKSLKFADARAWHPNVGYVVQRPHLVDGDILHNVTLGIDEDKVDMDRLFKVIKITKLDEVVDTLPEGIKSNIGQAASKLSGGQAQRISVARSLYKESQLLILDEATKSIDPATEKNIIKNIIENWYGQPIVMITHRIETLKFANRIYVIDKGRIIGEGSWEELSHTNQLFRDLTGQEEQAA